MAPPNPTQVIPDISFASNAQSFQSNRNAMLCHNRAFAAKVARKNQEAIELFRKAIELKEAGRMSQSSLGGSWNELGETYLQDGQLDAALEAFTKALNIRASLTPREIHLFDTSVTRENIARVYEAKNDPANAKKAREEGIPLGEVCCSNYRCNKKEVMDAKKLKRCKHCMSSWYCGTECQLVDWKSRHKRHCKDLAAAQA
ncbi:hypothetical protein DL93DRAFT_2229025 [Clavulina sp. PMI_390]|nr:hypothetical protein DL93DRAFT_2229025 [Clavulina sp. PMI_390]